MAGHLLEGRTNRYLPTEFYLRTDVCKQLRIPNLRLLLVLYLLNLDCEIDKESHLSNLSTPFSQMLVVSKE